MDGTLNTQHWTIVDHQIMDLGIVGLSDTSVVVACSVFVYRHRMSPRERVGVHFDALPRYQP
jgi:hypothetical protein